MSQLWSCVVFFCGEWRRVSFRKGEGGRGASQLWSWVLLSSVFFWGAGGQSASGLSALELGVVVVCFFFGGGGGPVSFRAVKGEGGRVSFGVVLSSSAGNGGESAGASQLLPFGLPNV